MSNQWPAIQKRPSFRMMIPPDNMLVSQLEEKKDILFLVDQFMGVSLFLILVGQALGSAQVGAHNQQSFVRL